MKKFLIMLIILAIAYFGATWYMQHAAGKEVAETLEKTNAYVNVTYNKATMDVLGWHPHLKDVTISAVGSKGNTQVDDLIIYQFDQEHEIPFYAHINFKGINIKVNQDNFGTEAQDLQELGYKELNGNMEIDYTYDPEKKELRLNTFRLGADDVGSLNVEFHLSQIDLRPESIAFLLFSFQKILIHRAELRYEDDSLIPKLQKHAAEQQDKSVDEVIKAMTDDIDREIAKTDNKFTKDALNALKDFVQDPDNISMTITPKEPVSLGQLQKVDPDELPEVLNIKVKS